MDFGEWVHEIRIKRNFDVRVMADKTGIDGSTISRIENAKAQPTLYTAFRICVGLDIAFPTLIYELKGSYPSTQKMPEKVLNQVYESRINYSVNSKEATSFLENLLVAIHDIENLIDFFRIDERACKTYLASSLNRIMANDAVGHLEVTQGEIFVPEDIDKLLLVTSFYRFELKYPSNLSAEDLLTIYKQGGVLTLTDIGVYMKKARTQQKMSLEKLGDKIKISSSVLSRLETGLLDHIKLIDILTLDEQLGQDWTIVGMYWEACKFQEKFLYHQNNANDEATSSFQGLDGVEFKLASLYVIVCRWLYYFSLNREIIHQW